jgi:primosomal protein N'
VGNTNVNSSSKIKKINEELKKEQYVISTSILSCETSFFHPDIIIFPNADVGLSLPDFNVAEKHFLFLNDFFKKYRTTNYIIQTFDIEHYVYKYLLDLD